MAVPKGRRSESRFEASHYFYGLRKEVTNLILMDFGFSKEKYQKKIDRYRETHAHCDNVVEVVERLQMKMDAFDKWFVDEEGRAILSLLRRIEEEFTTGNSIYPSETPARLMEFMTRRYHINKAIGLCYSLKQELNYVIRTLPVDINKYERFAEMIDHQVNLYKGVRQSDNRLIKPRKNKKHGKVLDTMDQHVINIFDSLAVVIRRIGRIESAMSTNSGEAENQN